MIKPTQLMPELLFLRNIASKPHCPYCHGENGTHFSNCWGPEGQAAWSEVEDDRDIVVSRIEVERLIEDNEDLRAEVEELQQCKRNEIWLRAENTRLRETLEYIASNTTHYMHEWVRNYARTALEKK